MGEQRAIAVYLRVSTTRQDLRAQEPEVREWVRENRRDRPVQWYRDQHTGRSLDRPALQQLEKDIAAGKVGTVVVWRNDRMGRRARHLLAFLEDLDERGVRYISIREGHLTGESAAAKMFRHMLAGMAEYESNVISERTRAALAAKRARGETWGGRKPGQRYRLTESKLQSVRALLAEGLPKAEIARQLSISRSTVYEAIKLLSTLDLPRPS